MRIHIIFIPTWVGGMIYYIEMGFCYLPALERHDLMLPLFVLPPPSLSVTGPLKFRVVVGFHEIWVTLCFKGHKAPFCPFLPSGNTYKGYFIHPPTHQSTHPLSLRSCPCHCGTLAASAQLRCHISHPLHALLARAQPAAGNAMHGCQSATFFYVLGLIDWYFTYLL